MRSPILVALVLQATGVLAGPTLTNFPGEQMSFDPADSGVSGAAPNWNVVIDVLGENGGLLTSSLFRRWWGAQIAPLSPGDTLSVTLQNFGAPDVILPVWRLSTDGGATFGPAERVPTSATPTPIGGTPSQRFQFTLTVPPGVNAIRLYKYFPYTVADRDALLASIAGHPHVRSITTIGTTVQGRDVKMIEITDVGVPDAGKHRVWIHAAIHSAETTSDFLVEGLLDFLLSGRGEAEALLDHVIFDIVPMLNVDGVALGNYRASAPNPPSHPNGADMEQQFGAPYTPPFPEIQAVISQIESFMGTSASPGSNPIEMLLNLHTTHGHDYPLHFRHVATYPPTGVVPEVNALETLWINLFGARSPLFTGLGSIADSTLGTRGFVESMMHDRWSSDPAWYGPPNNLPRVMAITYEGTYQRGHSPTLWNTPDDYRQNGEELALAIADFFGINVPAEMTGFFQR